jgi:hypothetical protein
MPPKVDGTPPEEKLRNIYFAVGFAMTQWQHVEQALTQLFLILLKAQNAGAASAAFASVLGFRSKLSMVDSAAFVVLGKTPSFAEWISLNKSLGRNASKRNQIAHFMLYQRAVGSSPNEPVPDVERLNREIDWYLSPTTFDGAVEYRYDGDRPRLTTTDVMNRANAFIKASNRLWSFSEKVRGLTGGS